MRSFLGVGAPEAILVAVVALVVFGPKGLADVSHTASRRPCIGSGPAACHQHALDSDSLFCRRVPSTTANKSSPQ